jgi:hypothetical protein
MERSRNARIHNAPAGRARGFSIDTPAGRRIGWNLRRFIPMPDGAVAQLGERMTGSHEVVGSIPISSKPK